MKINLTFVDGDVTPDRVEGVIVEAVPRKGESVGWGEGDRVSLYHVVDVRHYLNPQEIHVMLSGRP